MADTVIYFHLQHEHYKSMEEQMKAFKETTHVSTPGPFYHKSIRIRISPNLIIEFHGSLVRGEELPQGEEVTLKENITLKGEIS